MWRQGDVFIQSCKKIPKDAKRLPHCTLAKGELTGHAHRVKEPKSAILYELEENMYLDVTSDRIIVTHEEHDAVVLDRGVYRVWIQREYTPQEIRRVLD